MKLTLTLGVQRKREGHEWGNLCPWFFRVSLGLRLQRFTQHDHSCSLFYLWKGMLQTIIPSNFTPKPAKIHNLQQIRKKDFSNRI